jgi:hypothetical protein
MDIFALCSAVQTKKKKKGKMQDKKNKERSRDEVKRVKKNKKVKNLSERKIFRTRPQRP